METIQVMIRDGIGPKLNMLEEALENHPPYPGPEELGNYITEGIQNRYETGQSRWPPLSDKWATYKRRHGYDPRKLHQHDTKPWEVEDYLANVVKNLHIESTGWSISEGLHETIVNNLMEEFAPTPYVWLHEFGIGVPKRDFILSGVRAGLYAYMRAVQDYFKKIGRLPADVIWTIDNYWGLELERDRAKWSIWGILHLLLWFLPPTEYWKYLGIAFEIQNIATGELVEFSHAEAFIQAYIFSRLASQTTGMPVYRKAIRRRFRHTIYAGRYRGR